MYSLEGAKTLDEQDELRSFRAQFYIPERDGKQLIYFCGHSLGLQPKATAEYINQELEDWSKLGVEGHFKAKHPWLHYHTFFSKSLAALVGAKPSEVIAMNSLTVNLHLLLTSFYRPTGKRVKIIMEANSFSSDVYAVYSQIKLHGLSPKKVVIELKPRKNEYTLRMEDIAKTIHSAGNELSLVMMSGVNYLTGQAYDIEAITKAAHKVGAKAGFDLAHSIGNTPLSLHKWGVDFAVWCSYKYLNSGPGAVGGAYIHERYASGKTLHRLAGWWGHDETERFLMKPEFKPSPGAAGWQLSNAPVFNMCAHRASLDIFDAAGMKAIVKKSRSMVTYLEDMLVARCNKEMGYAIRIITPRSIDERGNQLSIMVHKEAQQLFNLISDAGFVCDYRHPNIIRVAVAPLYNSYEEVYHFATFMAEHCKYVS
ncbi:MAG: kynureninase [Cytophagaceae bacterium]|nr:kynureninase [Cytophagaceae bacterium]MDW8457047.1 kynureninase [Cytophagaceae bacterium]